MAMTRSRRSAGEFRRRATTTIWKARKFGLYCGVRGDLSGDLLYQPTGVALDSASSLCIADLINGPVRKVGRTSTLTSTLSERIQENSGLGSRTQAQSPTTTSPPKSLNRCHF